MEDNYPTQIIGRLSPNEGVEFLLREFEALNTLHIDAKEIGEKRLNFFVTLTLAFGSFLIAVRQFLPADAYAWLLLFGLVIIICLGIVTFRKMIQRRVLIIICRRRLNRIRAWFAYRYHDIVSALPYGVGEDIPMDWGKSKLGTSAATVAMINTVLVAIVAVAGIERVFGLGLSWWSIPTILISGVVTWQIHLYWKRIWIHGAELRDTEDLKQLDALSGTLKHKVTVEDTDLAPPVMLE
jgi:hypothetical protein